MKLDDILNNPKIPDKIKETVRKLPDSGKKAIVNFYDENSEYKINDSLDKVLKELAFVPKENRILYHYTTVENIKLILKSHTWLIKQKDFMNDRQEFSYTIKLSEDILMSLKATSDEIKAFDDLFKTKPIGDTYIWSFTQAKASQALFGNYSDKHNGVALGLDSGNVQRALFSHFSHGKRDIKTFTDGDAYPFPLKVIYDEKIQMAYLKPAVEEWLLAYRGLETMPGDRIQILSACLTVISYFALCFKNPLLWQEEEIRFIITYRGKDNEKFAERMIGSTPFVTCHISSELIREAIIQTGNSTTILELKDLFEKYKFNAVKVSNSELPY